MARTPVLWLAAGCFAVAGAAAQPAGVPDRIERPFVSGGKVRMSLSAGAYRIEGSPDNIIRVRWRTRDSEDMDRVRARVDVEKSEASIRLDGPRNSFRGDIEVPRRTDIVIRLSAGDLIVRRIEGNKDVDLWAGDVTIETGEANRYRSVNASVRAGEITADVFRVNKGGLFRSFKYDGKGPYDLRVKLFAGDLKLVR